MSRKGYDILKEELSKKYGVNKEQRVVIAKSDLSGKTLEIIKEWPNESIYEAFVYLESEIKENGIYEIFSMCDDREDPMGEDVRSIGSFYRMARVDNQVHYLEPVEIGDRHDIGFILRMGLRMLGYRTRDCRG